MSGALSDNKDLQSPVAVTSLDNISLSCLPLSAARPNLPHIIVTILS